jgi:(p)ppGpp synthase/HD superfamily hydrolase
MKTPTQTELAREIATKQHDGQFRWDGTTPYISHPAAVAKAIADGWDTQNGIEVFYPALKDAAVAAAWLHDVVEDCPITLAELSTLGMNPLVVSIVKALTKTDDQEYLSYILTVKEIPIARMIKIQDIKHNMSNLDRKRKKSMYDKYTLALYILEGRK